MFTRSDKSRIFALPPGADFARELVAGINSRIPAGDPMLIARTTIWTNTRRSARAIEQAFLDGSAGFLPSIRVIADLPGDPALAASSLVRATPRLVRKLSAASLIRALLLHEPGLLPAAATFDLADSLLRLMNELEGQGVSAEDLEQPFPVEMAEHWQKSWKFISILARLSADLGHFGDEKALRAAIGGLSTLWQKSPPSEPILVAGSTGSRPATAAFMRLVATLPQGAVILPGYDFHMSPNDWPHLEDDHPQARFHRLFAAGEGKIAPSDVQMWKPGCRNPTARNRLISLALRPVPVTDQWLSQGAAMKPDLPAATADMALVEADTPREEAMAIAVRMRLAVEQGRHCALVTPDRSLARRVAAALARWNVLPDDSAGTPLNLTPPGIFLRLSVEFDGDVIAPARLLAVLKHPLCCAGNSSWRTRHLDFVRRLEIGLLRGGPPLLDAADLRAWPGGQDDPDNELLPWVEWIAATVETMPVASERLADHVERHRNLSQRLAAGPEGNPGILWEQDSGQMAARLLESLSAAAADSMPVSGPEYRNLFRTELDAAGDVRDQAYVPHPLLAIWGTLEARLQCRDIVILGGLNEGIWPASIGADPWLNRNLRQALGMIMPEMQIGLSAHDFQQAAAAPEVILTRAARDGEAPTLASRWLRRLTNLLEGLGTDDQDPLAQMRARGAELLGLARQLEMPEAAVPAAPRPAPSPPIEARPTRLSVTQIETLIRDPYAIYARHVLNLKKLNPLGRDPDALERGTTIHAIMEEFVHETWDGLPENAEEVLDAVAARVLEKKIPWPDIRLLWRARLARSAKEFLAGETARRSLGKPLALEVWAAFLIVRAHRSFEITAKADRLDLTPAGAINIYDYKAGSAPSRKDIQTHAVQLALEGALAERGAFRGIAAAPAAELAYIGLGSPGKPMPVGLESIGETWSGLENLLVWYDDPSHGYAARIRPDALKFGSDYDHLSRHGEWSDGDDYVDGSVP